MPSIRRKLLRAAKNDPHGNADPSQRDPSASRERSVEGADTVRHLDDEDRRLLLDLAWSSIRHGLATGAAIPVRPDLYPPHLCGSGASFVTLHRHGRLRGCIGRLDAVRPLAEDVAENAFAAAFRDPRFAPLRDCELDGLDLSVSVLTAPEPIRFADEADLMSQLRPGVDGLVLADRGARGTFLPAVWEALPEPARFLAELKRKAGFPPDYWSPTLEVSRYRTETFG